MSHLDMYELYYLVDIIHPKGSGVRLSKNYLTERKLEDFIRRMQIAWLNKRLGRRPVK